MGKKHPHSRFDDGSRDGAYLFTAHDDGLFDQNESASGERYDLATGRPINNSTHGYDNFGSLMAEEIAELGYSIDGDDDLEDDVVDLFDAWDETGRGLAKAAGIDYMFDHEDIA